MVRTTQAGAMVGLVLALVGASQAVAAERAPQAERLAAPPARSCVGHGPGFVAIPGSDTCIRIGGRVRAEAGGRVARAPSDRVPVAVERPSIGASGRIAVDARTQTDYGPARAFVRFGSGQR